MKTRLQGTEEEEEEKEEEEEEEEEKEEEEEGDEEGVAMFCSCMPPASTSACQAVSPA